MKNMIKVNVWKYSITKHVTKFGSRKIDNCGDTIVSSVAIYYQTPYSKLMRFSSSDIVIRKHHCISTVINFVTTDFCDNLLHDQIPQCIYFNPFFYQTAHWYDHPFMNGCIYENVNSLQCIVCECLHCNFPINLSTENACAEIRGSRIVSIFLYGTDKYRSFLYS